MGMLHHLQRPKASAFIPYPRVANHVLIGDRRMTVLVEDEVGKYLQLFAHAGYLRQVLDVGAATRRGEGQAAPHPAVVAPGQQ